MIDRVGAGALPVSLMSSHRGPRRPHPARGGAPRHSVSRSLARGGAAETVVAQFADALEDALSSIHDAGRRHALYVCIIPKILCVCSSIPWGSPRPCTPTAVQLVMGSPVITSSEVRDRPLHVITDRCIPMRTPHPKPSQARLEFPISAPESYTKSNPRGCPSLRG